MDKNIEIAAPITLVDIIDIEPDAVKIKPIFKKTTVDMNLLALDKGKELEKKILPFDTIAQVIEGVAEVDIDGKPQILEPGQAIIIPPHTPYQVKAKEPSKIIFTVLKSGYEI